MAMNHEPDRPTLLTPEQASGGYTVFRTPLRKAIFIGGLVLFVIVAAFLAYHRPGA